MHVIGKRADGYHNLETVFLPVHDLCDKLDIEPRLGSQKSEVVQEGISLDNAPEENLCMKAWQLLHDEFDIPPVSIHLVKKIPFGAGLGGGSSDAAFTLKMLNGLYSLNLSNSELEHRASRLGADCAFFVRNQAAFATGIGDNLTPIEIDLNDYKILIEIPGGEHVSTKEAYSGLRHDLFGATRPNLCEIIKQPVECWRDIIVNDFETSVLPSHPAIAELKEAMYRRGAVYASMTGSGAAVFGLFKR